jgi:rhodanese-related sulfurtransferase
VFKLNRLSALLSLAFVVVAVAVMFVTSAVAEESKPDTPKTLSGVKVVSVDEVKALLEKKEVKFFDMRSAVNYGKGHLSGAVALPYKENSEYKVEFDASKDSVDLSKLPADKNTAILFYSDGPKGWKSYKAATLARKAGYKKIMWFREGTAAWEAKGYKLQ